MSRRSTVIFLGDGMADEPIAELGNRTPVQAASTPGMDSIASAGCSGTFFTLPDEFPTSSEVANMSVLGCDLPTEYCGRGPLEAKGRNIDLNPDDTAFRLNLTTEVDGVITDFSGGHISQEDAEELIKCLDDHFGNDNVKFHSGVSYRNILVLSGDGYSPHVKTDKPDDNHGECVADHLPRALEPAGEETAAFLCRIMAEAGSVLEQHPVNQRLAAEGRAMANGVWPWSGGRAGALKSLKEKYGITSAVISAVDVIVGLGRTLGMDVIEVPGATGYIDTNYEGKADAAIEALKTHDLVYVHVEAIDEVSHAQDLEKKIMAIEDFDSRLICRVLDAVGDSVNAAVLPDHPVPVVIGRHTRTPVPVSVHIEGMTPDSVEQFDEISCPGGSLGSLKGEELMKLLFAQ